MPLDPANLKTWLNVIIPWCNTGLHGFGARFIPGIVVNSMVACLASAETFVNSDRWEPWIESLNGK